MWKKGVLCIAVIFTLLGCGEDEIPLFEMKLEANFDIDPGLNPIVTHYYTINNVSTFFNSYSGNVSPDAIGSIRPSTCIISGGLNGIDYDFIQEIYINAINPADPSQSKEVFYLEENQFNNESDLRMFGSLLDVKDLFINELVHLEVRMKVRVTTPGIAQNRISFSLLAFAEE